MLNKIGIGIEKLMYVQKAGRLLKVLAFSPFKRILYILNANPVAQIANNKP